MALIYPGFVQPKGTDLTLLDVANRWNQGVDQGTEQKQTEQAPGLIEKSVAPLAEFGLDTTNLRGLLSNPQTRDLAIQQIREATARRSEANDPLRQLQLKKAQFEVAHQGDAPRNTLMDSANTRGKLGWDNGLRGAALRRFVLTGDLPDEAKPPSIPDGVESLDLRAQRAGLVPGTPEYKDFMIKGGAGGGQTSLSVGPDGTVSFQQGAGGMPRLTEGQGKDVGFATRMSGALPVIDDLGGHLTELGGNLQGKIPYGGYLQSEDYQKAQQAGDEFLTGLLRKDSGGAITPDEKNTYGLTYLPQPGDKPGVLEQKKVARRRALKAIELGLPAAAVLQMEKEGISIPDLPGAGGSASPAGAPATPKSDAEYNALPSGALFVDPDDGQTYRKP